MYKREGVRCKLSGGDCFVVQQSYGLEVEAVEEPFGPRLGAPAPLAVR